MYCCAWYTDYATDSIWCIIWILHNLWLSNITDMVQILVSSVWYNVWCIWGGLQKGLTTFKGGFTPGLRRVALCGVPSTPKLGYCTSCLRNSTLTYARPTYTYATLRQTYVYVRNHIFYARVRSLISANSVRCISQLYIGPVWNPL